MKDYYLFKESLNLNWHSLGSIGILLYQEDSRIEIVSVDRTNPSTRIEQTHPKEAWDKLIPHEILYT